MLLRFYEKGNFGYINTDKIEYFYLRQNMQSDNEDEYTLFAKTSKENIVVEECVSWKEHLYIMDKISEALSINNGKIIIPADYANIFNDNTFLEYCMLEDKTTQILERAISKISEEPNFCENDNFKVFVWMFKNLTKEELKEIDKIKEEYFNHLNLVDPKLIRYMK